MTTLTCPPLAPPLSASTSPQPKAPAFSASRFFRRALTCLALACGLLAPAAQAANITKTCSFVATYPSTTVTGSFTVTFDPAVSVTNQSSGITVNSLNIPTQGAVVFNYNSGTGNLAIGADGNTASVSGVNDFLVVFGNAATTPAPIAFTYSANPFNAPTTLTRGDIVSGGWVNGGNFAIGTIGTANDTNNWPAAESPDKATDGNAATKFLIFKGSNTGLIITPPSAATYNRLALTTAGDASERDPASYIIYGTTTALATSGNIPISSLTLIQQGTLALTNDRNAGPAIAQFNNTTAYASYVVVFPAIKNNPTSDITQIAEVKLSQGMTVPNQVPVGKVRGGQLVGNTFTLGSVGSTNPGNNWSAGQSPDYALDGSVSSKYLLFQNNGAGLIVAPEAGPTIINSLSFWTADDEPNRDPLTYKVYGSTTAATGYSGAHGVGSSPWTLIQDTTTVTLPAARSTGPTTVNFTNATAYTSYLVVFPTVKSTSGNTITQISEVAFANVPTNSAPTNITLSNATIPENNAPGATIGTLTATDPDAGQTHTFSFGGGSEVSIANAAFTIEGNTLKIKDAADFETKSSYTISIRATDNGNPAQSFDKEFIVTITDVTLPQTITFGALANKTFGDGAFDLSATGGASLQPVIFSIEYGPATISGYTVTITGSGSVGVRATQAGAGEYGAAPYVVQGFYVNPQPQVITFAPLANKTLGDASFTVSATGGASGQPVIFSIPGGPASVLGNTVTLTGAGTVYIIANQAGGTNHAPAQQVTQSFTVAPAPQTITFNLPTTALTTDTVPLFATGGPSGYQVYFSVFSGPGTISGNSLTFTGPGAVVVRAFQFGDSNYLNAADVQRTITASVPAAPLAVIDPTSTDITATTATLGGNATGDGSLITERGVVYSLTSANADPLVAGSGVTRVTTTGTTGVFTVPVTGLLANRSYSFKAYAMKGVRSTTYTPVATFTSGYANSAPSFALPAQGPSGEVWTKRESVRDWAAVACSADANKITALVKNGTAYTSSDFGVTWTAQPGSGSRNWSAITSSADGAKLAATTTGGFIYTSTDSGVTWTERSTSGSRNWSRIATSTDGTKLAAIVTGSSGTRSIFTSADSGATWTERTTAGSREWRGIASSADGTKLAAAVGGGSGNRYLYTSTDSGATWTERTSAGSKNWKDIASSANGAILTASGDGAFNYRSLDGGATWAPGYGTPRLAYATNRQTCIAVSADSSKLAIGGNLFYITTSNDGGASFSFQEGQRIWTAIAMSADGTRIVASASNANIFTSTLTPPQIRVLPGSGVSTTAGFASAISPGPAADAGQTVSFQVTTPDTALFTTPPAISASGTLTFTPGTTYGVATVTVRAMDTGGTASGGQDTSAPQTFTVMVAPEPGMTVDIVFDPATGKTRINYSGNWGIRAGNVAGDSNDISQYRANYGPNWIGRYAQGFEIHNISSATPDADILYYGDDTAGQLAQSGQLPQFLDTFTATAWGGDFWGYDIIGIFGPEAAFTPTGRISGFLEFDKTLTEMGLSFGDSGVATFTPSIPTPVWPAGVATMTWAVRTANAAPTFSGYAFSTKKNTSASVAVAKILARAADADGGTLSITAVSPASAQNGTVSLNGGAVSFSPQNNYTGLDTFTVTISDGLGGSVVGIVTVNVTAGTGGTLNQAKITVLPGGNVALLFMGIPGQQYLIQRSTDMTTWATVSTVTAAADGTLPYTDTNPPLGGSAFYRTTIPGDTVVELLDGSN